MVYEQASSLYIYTSLCDEESKFRLLYPTIKCFYNTNESFLDSRILTPCSKTFDAQFIYKERFA